MTLPLKIARRQAHLAEERNLPNIRVKYQSRSSGKDSWLTLHPYGLLYGRKSHLVSYNPQIKAWRLLLLANMLKVTETEDSYKRNPDFSLQSYAARSFGVFQEDPVDVVLKFSPAVAKDALAHQFHPTQTVEKKPDGSLIIRFTAGGLTEMCWHLFTWGSAVEILKPPALRDRMRHMCEDSLKYIV